MKIFCTSALFSLVFIIILVFLGGRMLVYRYEIKAKIPKEVLWHEWELVMKDSLKSQIWPNSLETLSSEGGVTEGSLVESVYHVFRLNKRVQYRIFDVKHGVGFKFSPVNDHFNGFDYVELFEDGPHASRLVWVGDYRISGVSLAAIFFKYFYEKRFFEEFEKQIQKLESTLTSVTSEVPETSVDSL